MGLLLPAANSLPSCCFRCVVCPCSMMMKARLHRQGTARHEQQLQREPAQRHAGLASQQQHLQQQAAKHCARH